MKGVDAVAKILQKEGVEYLFSYPNHPLIEAAAKLGIRPIIARSEKTLINIADGYTRALNGVRPTVVVVQGGPGIENAFGGLAQAASDGVPLLTIPGGADSSRLGSGEFDPLPVYSHIMKWAGRINRPDRISELMNRAFSQLRNGKLGPVLLELPRDTGGADVDEAVIDAYTPPRKYRSAGDPGDVAEAARLLTSASRPVLHAGHGVLWAQAWDELRELAELVQAPVVTTMAGKSAFPEDHPLALGAGGHSMTQTSAEFLVRADLVFGIGASFAKGAFSFPIPAGKKIVQVVADGRDLNKDYPITYAVIGDAKLVLRQLIDEIKQSGAATGRDGVAEEVRAAKDAFLDEWLPRLTADTAPISPYRVIWDLMHTVDRRQTVVTHDSGNPRDQTLPFFEVVAPRGYLGWGKSTQLGTGYGMALGAKLAHPEKLCINIMGDLAFGTAGMEIETAFREKLPIMTVLLNNSVLGGYSNYMPTASEKFNSNKLTGDYTAVARGLGAYAERVERPEDVRAAIERGVQATQEGRPVVLEMITREEPVFPDSNRVLKEIAERELTPA
ncbi:MAG: thiamine pyrophosphate-requiring protein [Chloroflexota bacterium]|nr:thiamine pyrophosphate-requiring protein [Chloroflexota bacterium]